MDQPDLPAGDALDALVATHVCGWQEVQYSADQLAYYGWPPDSNIEDNISRVPTYSTDLRWAWSVIDALRHRDLLPAFLSALGQHYQTAAADHAADEYQVLAAFLTDHWASRTICRVALRVVGKP